MAKFRTMIWCMIHYFSLFLRSENVDSGINIPKHENTILKYFMIEENLKQSNCTKINLLTKILQKIRNYFLWIKKSLLIRPPARFKLRFSRITGWWNISSRNQKLPALSEIFTRVKSKMLFPAFELHLLTLDMI